MTRLVPKRKTIQRQLVCLVLLCALALTRTLVGAEVVKVGEDYKFVTVSHDPAREWQVNDQVCVIEKTNEEIKACGLVMRSVMKGALVRFTVRLGEIKVGDLAQWVIVPWMKSPKERELARKSGKVPFRHSFVLDLHQKALNREVIYVKGLDIVEQETFWELEEHATNTYSITGGFNFLYPIIHGQKAVGKHFTLGLMGTYLSHDIHQVKTTSFGGLLTLSYYGKEPFRGLWFQVGAGPLYSSLDYLGQTGNGFFLTVMMSVGWRWFLGEHINSGLGVGGMYCFMRSNSFIPFDNIFLLPTVIIDIGFTF